MDQIIFYNLEKNNVRLSVQGGTSFENAINMCQEFTLKLQEQMAAEIARQDLAAAKAADQDAPEEIVGDLSEEIIPELLGEASGS